MAQIAVNGISVQYQLHGPLDAPPLVFIAGMGGAGSFWTPQLEAFARTYRVLVYDQRGTGGTERVKVDSVEQLADDLIALMRELGMDGAHLVGHSTGGAIAMVMAVRAPDLVRSLVLYASVHRADAYRRRVWGLRKQILQQLGPEVYARTTSLFFYPPEYVARNDEAIREAEGRAASSEVPAPEIQASRIDAILNFEYVEPLSQVKAPTLVYCAEDDMLTPAYFSREIASLIPGARLVLLPRGGHAFSRSRTEEFNNTVLEFVGSLVDGPGGTGRASAAPRRVRTVAENSG